MEKYGTYDVYKNKRTNELMRIPHTNDPALIKSAGLNNGEWEKLNEDPEDKDNG